MAQPEERSLEMVRRLVAFDTTSRGSNLPLIEFVRDYLEHLGITSELVFDETGAKANLFATIDRTEAGGGVMLSGHTDVVPVDGQDWHSDPFSVLSRDGRLYGRGTADMKSFLAVVLALLPEFVGRPAKAPLHLAFSYDEEVGCRGARRLIPAILAHPARPALCVVGEPTEMRPVIGHKGKRSYRCHVRGYECHSALAHEGVNAIEAAAELITCLKGMAREKRAAGPFDPDFVPPYTTIHTGVIRGGTALNIIPKECSFDFEFRLLPGDDPEAPMKRLQRLIEERLLPEMQAVRPETGIRFEEISSFPGLATAPDAEVTRLVAALTGANGTGKVSFGTEAGLFDAAGIPAVVCGPGSIEQAHKPDEFIEIEQIGACEAFVRRLFARLCA